MKRHAFTLIELLVTIAIIAMLAGMLMVALDGAATSAKDAKTRAMIAKLNTIITPQYEKYKTRRVPISTAGMQPNQIAPARLNALRELMRLEMPDRYTEIPATTVTAVSMPGNITMARPALSMGYARKLSASHSTAYQTAECLYMIVMSDRENAALFESGDIGDTDNDGMPEFLDGWRHPISWLRWPTGLVSELQNCDPAAQHDPFDSYNVQASAFATYPLVYSAGPDGEYEIEEGGVSYSYPYTSGILDPYAAQTGKWLDVNGDGKNGSIDNIHNHMMQTK